ncbi:hypothetical protein KEM56_002308 [Ascosphaera pollenicola]|nr:hypothetical protein KEM56_002308 [Ascosphaera pollenicola]
MASPLRSTAEKAASDAISENIRRSVIEVERKFQYDPKTVKRFRMNDGNPPFRQLDFRGKDSFRDIYYDFENEILTKSGLYVRQRNGQWEAKLKQSGDFNNSQFEEVKGRRGVLELLLQLEHRACIAKDKLATQLPRLEPTDYAFGLPVFADLQTTREKWVVNDMFNVVLDTTNFGHGVGEVELEETLVTTLGMEDFDEAKRQLGADMDKRIETFMKSHAWAFPPGKPVGKLTAYFAWKDLRSKGVTPGIGGRES